MSADLPPSALTLLDLYRRHHAALRQNDEESRARIFKMIDDLRWAYPDSAKAIDDLYGEKP